MTGAHKKQPKSKTRIAPLVPVLAQPSTAMIVGYARVSTEDQDSQMQIAALKAAGCQKIFDEKISAMNAKRPRFNLLMKFLERGDTLIINALTRLGRNATQVRDTLDYFEKEGIAWRSLTEPHFDTRTAVGRYMINNAIAMGQFESDQVSERTKRGLAHRIAGGMYIGAPRKVALKDIPEMKRLRKRGMSCAHIAAKFNVSVSAVYSNTNR